MVNANTRENQHYVPKFLLRNFAMEPGARRGADKVHAFDKLKGRSFVANVRNVAAAFEFYDLGMGSNKVSLEGFLSNLEGEAARAIAKVIVQRSLSSLSADEQGSIIMFCTVQLMRTQSVREQLERISKSIEDRIRKMGHDPAKVEGFRPMTEADLKANSIQNLVSALKSYPAILADKVWFLLEAPADAPFFIGDHPVTFHNDRQFGPYGNIGIAVPGIQIYLPMTPRLTLAMWHESILDEALRGNEESERLVAELLAITPASREQQAQITASLSDLRKAMDRTSPLIAAAQTGGVVSVSRENVTMLNSLQVGHSARFVMSSDADFSLVEKMLADNPAFRTTAGDGLRTD